MMSVSRAAVCFRAMPRNLVMGSSTRLFHQALALRAADPLAKTVKNIMPVEVTSVEPHDYDKLAKEGYTEKEIIDLKKQYGWGRERGPDDISDNVKKILRLLRTLDIVETTELMDEMSKMLHITQYEMDVLADAQNLVKKRKKKGKGGAEEEEDAGKPKVAAKKEEQTVFTVKLTAFDAAAKIKLIKEVRGVTGLGLKEAKELVESAPATIKEGLNKEDAAKLVEALKAVGGSAESV